MSAPLLDNVVTCLDVKNSNVLTRDELFVQRPLHGLLVCVIT